MLANQLVWHRVVMLLILDMVVRADFGAFDFGIKIGLYRQWF
jgi:hypothetical protein